MLSTCLTFKVYKTMDRWSINTNVNCEILISFFLYILCITLVVTVEEETLR